MPLVTASPRGVLALSHFLPVFVMDTLRTTRPHHSWPKHLCGKRPPTKLEGWPRDSLLRCEHTKMHALALNLGPHCLMGTREQNE